MPPKIVRWSYIHSRVKELGFPGLGEYLAQRYVRERKQLDDMAKECHVTRLTLLRHLRLYGLETGTPREPKPTRRQGKTLFCNGCGTGKYYSPAQATKLQEGTYKCRTCRDYDFIHKERES